MNFRAATLLEELDVEGCIVEHRRGELYRLAAKRIRELETELKIQDDAADILTRNAEELRKCGPSVRAIESAPKDATRILAFESGRGWRVVFWRGGWNAWFSEPGQYGSSPTHWMPLPDSPLNPLPATGNEQEKSDG